MRIDTRKHFNALQAAMAKSYGTDNASQQFTATTPMAQELNDAIQKSVGFLSRITVIPRVDLVGEVLRMSILSTVAGRTDTSSTGERSPQRAGGPDGRQYAMKQTNFDVAIPYSLMDTWARYPDFKARYSKAVQQRIGLDRLLIGWYGTSQAATTDRATNTKLQDVNKGWIFDLKSNKPEHYISPTGTGAAGQINLGPTGDYKNLDHLVFSLFSLIPEEHRTGNEVAIIGQGLVAWETGKMLIDHAGTPTEKNAIKVLGKSYGGLESVMVPTFPDNGLLIIDPANLHIYFQDSSVRRQSVDNPKKDQVEDYISMNEAYMIANLEAAVAIDDSKVVFE
ncbi:MAG: hypothetical protein RL095_2170 [Verrucomicrobiota bacterium]|jgi:P2 family phage major capsid protein